MSKKSIGIVSEVYSLWERRAPFTPEQVEKIVKRYGIEVYVQPSGKRFFPDNAYAAAGAKITNDLSQCNAIFGVKQVPKKNLLPNKTYLFFSHTIKGQLENMPLLDEILKKNIRLVDYECITKGGKPGATRLVAFGEYAGKAGFIDTLRGVGQQLLYKGVNTPFINVGSAYMYPSYQDASAAVERAGHEFVDANKGNAATSFNPLVFLFTGKGNVNRGARQVFKIMPHDWVHPSELEQFLKAGDTKMPIVGCQVDLEHMVQHIGGEKFSKEEFYQNPERYRSVFFERFARNCNVLVNGIYWDARYPRVVCKDDLLRSKKDNSSRMHFISDISCDIGGGIECLHSSTTIENPFTYVQDPVEASDIMMMGVDILPSELPREASQHFGNYLLPFVDELASNMATEELAPELRGACIADQGKLFGRFSYIEKMKNERLREKNGLPAVEKHTQLQLEGSTVVRFEGHLFDTNLINKMLDIVEAKRGRFHIVECLVGKNQKSTVMLQLTMDEGRTQLEQTLGEIKALADAPEFKAADATMEEMPHVCNGNYRATLDPNAKLQVKDAPAGAEEESSTAVKANIRAPLSWVPLKTVAVLGAGMVARPCVELLSRDTSRNVVLCSSLRQEAVEIAKRLGRGNIQPVELDASKQLDEMDKLISTCDAVISLLPQTMHVDVAKQCIKHKVPLVTASYVSPEMKALEQAAIENKVPILCEMGLDPGMDHMSAMMIIDQIKESGGKIESFTSLCGGLPAPEAANNPFGYKFSWSPAGVLKAMHNDASFLKNGSVVNVKGGASLLDAAEEFRMYMLPSIALEQLPNRNSLVYSDKYGIPEAKTCFRGTLRYQGFCKIFAEYLRAGFSREDISFDDAMQAFRTNVAPTHTSAQAMDWLMEGEGVYTNKLGSAPALSALSKVLQEKLVLKPGERDLCVMQHTFNNDHFSTLLVYGNEHDTGMARTVGLTAAIGAELFLDPSSKALDGVGGIFLPTEKRIYQPALERLERENIIFNHHRI